MSKLLDNYSTILQETLTNTKLALEEKKVEVPSETKLENVPDLIDKIDNGSKVELVISAPDYEGQTLTATKGEKSIKGQVQDGECIIPVDEGGVWKVSADDGTSIEIEATMLVSGELIKFESNKIYGVKITEATEDTEQRVTYLDDAIGKIPVKVDIDETGDGNLNSWKNSWIFQKIYPVMLKTNGEIDYRLDPNDQSKKISGEPSDISNINYDGNAMVCIEKFYTKFSMNGEDEEIRISDTKQDGFQAIGFIRENGSEADRIFLPMFTGSFDSNSKLRSLSNQDVKYNTSFTDFRTAAQNNDSGYDIETWAMNQAISAVYFILMKNCNPKTALGEGRTYSSAQTGILANKGAIAYDTSTKTTKFMYIEDFTSNYSNGMYRWEAGILAQDKKLYVKMKPPYSGTSTSGYTQVTDHVAGNNYINAMKCDNKYGRYGMAYIGSDSTYEAAYWNTNNTGGPFVSQRSDRFGVAGRFIYYSASTTYDNYGAALTYLPPATVHYD